MTTNQRLRVATAADSRDVDADRMNRPRKDVGSASDVYAIAAAYTAQMKRIQIYIDDPTDELLARRARKEHRSKAALIRDAVRATYGEAASDPFDRWAGGIDEEPGEIDEIVYRR
jgi:hypothetical protein